MAMNFKKREERKYTYMPKDVLKHKHNYVVECVLEITNMNIHASCDYYKGKEYYNVLKCDMCDSFIPNSKEGNYDGHIINRIYNKKLPLIRANTNMKNPAYYFNNLTDVVINNKKD